MLSGLLPKCAPATRRPTSPPGAGPQFGRSLHAQPRSPAAVAGLDSTSAAWFNSRRQATWQSLMKSVFRTFGVSQWLFALLVAQTVFVSGCTSALWDKNTFAHHYQPAAPANLRLFYSKERNDILVQYDESSDTDDKTRPRCYWLWPNTMRVNRERKPHFVSAKKSEGLIPIPVTEAPSNSLPPGSLELYAVAPRGDNLFTLYSGKEQLDPYQLPTYIGVSRRVKQVLLTPLAVGVDATIIGAASAYYSAPWIFAGLSR